MADRRPLLRRRSTWIVAGAIVALGAIALAVHLWAGHAGYDIDTARLGSWTYPAVFALVFGDAVFGVLPAETTLSAAAAMAGDGRLNLWLVMLAGALGAILGDSVLYWIARSFSARLQRHLDKESANPKVARALGLMGSRASVLLIVGRYVIGVRFVVSASLGLSRYPYRSFLVWSAVGGALWALTTCGLAYLITTTITGFPLASVVISGAITVLAVGIVLLVLRRTEQSQVAGRASDGV